MVTAMEMRAKDAVQMREARLQELVRLRAKIFQGRGLLHYHTHDARHSAGGFPDSHILMPGVAALWRELKRECICTPRRHCTFHPRKDQETYLIGLESVGDDAGIWTPSDVIVQDPDGRDRATREIGAVVRGDRSASGHLFHGVCACGGTHLWDRRQTNLANMTEAL